MALPWLIGGALLGLGALLASSSDDDNSSNGNGDDEERRRREKAEQARAARNKSEQRLAVQAAFREQGQASAEEFAVALQEWIEVHYRSAKPFAAVLSNDGEILKREVSVPFVIDYALGLLDSKTRKSLTDFEGFYDAQLIPCPEIYDADELITDCDDTLKEMRSYLRRLEKLRAQLQGE